MSPALFPLTEDVCCKTTVPPTLQIPPPLCAVRLPLTDDESFIVMVVPSPMDRPPPASSPSFPRTEDSSYVRCLTSNDRQVRERHARVDQQDTVRGLALQDRLRISLGRSDDGEVGVDTEAAAADALHRDRVAHVRSVDRCLEVRTARRALGDVRDTARSHRRDRLGCRRET